MFVFQDRKLKLSASVWKRISWNLTKFQLNQTTDRKNENNNCLNELNELKFCEVSRNSISNRCWKFQLSILKNEKVLFLKKIFLGRTAKVHPKDGVCRLNFPEGFGMNDETKNPDLQFLACTDIEYQYSKEPTNTYYVSLFLTLSKNMRLTAYILQIYMQTCHIILPYICKFHQLNFRIAKNVYVTFFSIMLYWISQRTKCKSKCNRLFWQRCVLPVSFPVVLLLWQ